jgi:hypothetical protein
MVTRTAMLAAFVAASCIDAAAGDIAGRYRSECTLPNGSQCSPATAEIEMRSERTCHIRWSTGEAGICVLDGTKFFAGYIIYGKAALGVYDVAPDGSIEGVFIDDIHGKGFGKEKLTPLR